MAQRAEPITVRRALAVLLLVGLMAAGITGCGKRVEDRLAHARQAMAKQDQASALLQVKAVLQAHPDQSEARLLLGTLLLNGGDPLAGEIELRRALELGRPEAEVLPLLARALLASNQPGKLVQQFGQLNLAEPLAAAQLKSALAEAEAALGDLDAARASLALALAALPGHEPALLLRARVTAVAGDLRGGLAQTEALLARNPGNADAWVLKGDLLDHLDADRGEVLQAYQQALAVRPDHAGAHAALVAQQLARNDAQAAHVQLEAMRKLLPRHPQTLLFEGQIAALDGDLPHARDVFQQLLRVLPEHGLLLQSAGAVELQLNAPVQAEVLLSRAVQLAPDSLPARRLLARAYLALGQNARAMATLEPLIQQQRADAEALVLAAQAELLTGRPAAAAALFDRAARLKPDDPKIGTAVALSHLARGQPEQALAELKAVAARDPGTDADMALIAALLRRKDLKAAQQAIAVLQAKRPGQPAAAHLRGQVLLQQGDRAAARQAFEQALALDAGHFPSVAALAGLDMLDHQPDAARSRLAAAVRSHPRLAQARLAQAELAARTGADRDQVTALLEDGIKASPGDAGLRLALVDHHLETLNPKAALRAAKAALVRLPDDPELLSRLGRAQLLVGDHQQALTTYNSLLALQPRSPAGGLGVAETQLAGGDALGAQRSVARVLAMAPDHLPAQRLAISLALRLRKPDQALALARQVQQQRPDQALGHLLEGEVEIAQQHWDAAVVALRRAVAKADPAQAPARLHHALRQAGRLAEAQALADDWTRRHPRDTLFRFYLGDVALAQRDLPAAQAHYEAVLQVNPEHALALNNVAWLLMARQLPGALPYAEHAVRVAPDRPALLDTLAQAQAQAQQLDQALASQRRALQIQPDDAALRLNLARYLAQAGEKRQAKTELDRLAALGEGFARQDEVAALLKRLGGR